MGFKKILKILKPPNDFPRYKRFCAIAEYFIKDLKWFADIQLVKNKFKDLKESKF